MIVEKISDIDTGRLLVFLSFGSSLLIFAINSSLVNRPANYHRYSGVYHFIKSILNFAILYIVAAVFLLLSTLTNLDKDFWSPFLYNIGFIITLMITIFFTLAYFRYVTFPAIQDSIIANRYNLED